jgi:hypothetical protein
MQSGLGLPATDVYQCHVDRFSLMSDPASAGGAYECRRPHQAMLGLCQISLDGCYHPRPYPPIEGLTRWADGDRLGGYGVAAVKAIARAVGLRDRERIVGVGAGLGGTPRLLPICMVAIASIAS